MNGVTCPTPSTCYAVGTATSYAWNVSTNGGSSWSRQLGNVAVGQRSWSGVACGLATACIAVGQAGPIYLAQSGRWQEAVQPNGVGILASATCPSATECYAVGQDQATGGGVVVTAPP